MRNVVLKALEGDAKRHFQKGHDLEKMHASNLMQDSLIDEFPFEKNKFIAEVILVQKLDKKTCQRFN